ncbi:hypothetical protein PQX77_008625 [Marasmius sp. AFHP31]|nr:hypothetical protein PQX77_008625 [Marasmius sp. AFHP31]
MATRLIFICFLDCLVSAAPTLQGGVLERRDDGSGELKPQVWVSTTSLPAYMKEPGEQEVVIFRGPADMEDVPIASVTAAVEMPTVAEDGDSENSVREQYAPMPDSPHDMPLLQNDDEEPGSRSFSALAPPTTDDQGRTSVETSNYNSEEGSSLARVDTALTADDTPDPRGAAPAYFEVVDLSDISGSTGESPIGNDNATTTTPGAPNIAQRNDNSDTQTPATSRRSFRISNIFGRSGSHRATQSSSSAIRQPVPPPPGIPVTNNTNVNRGHSRTESTGGLSLTTTVSRSTQGSPAARSRSRISVITNGHRPSQSSSSLLSLVNPLHRKKSTATLNSANLTSPSMISLNSISAPLSHTLVKTEITYPRSGPTPEQLKLISSRETFARFGLPYGDEAVRWAKSRTELVDDGVPPPEFEEIAGASGSSGPSGSSGNDDGGNSNAPPLVVSGSSGSSGNADAGPSTTNIASPEVVVHAASKPPSPRIPSPSIPDAAGVSAQNDASAVPSSPNKPTPSTPVDPTSIAIPDSPPTSPTSTLKAKTLPSPSRTEPVPPVPSMKPNTNTRSQPPSAFRTPPEVADPYSRAESRASSFRSFATANESLVSEFGERTTTTGYGNGSGSGGGGGGRSRSRNAGTYDSTRSETPALSIAESRYYTDYDDDDDLEEGSTFRLGAPGDSSDSGTDSGMETETEDERRERRLTVRAAA